MSEVNLAFSTKELVTMLLAGKRITMHIDNMADFNRIFANLNTEKSRSKKAHEDFGLEFDNQVIKVDPPNLGYEESTGELTHKQVTFYCAPKIIKRYAVFDISESTPEG